MHILLHSIRLAGHAIAAASAFETPDIDFEVLKDDVAFDFFFVRPSLSLF